MECIALIKSSKLKMRCYGYNYCYGTFRKCWCSLSYDQTKCDIQHFMLVICIFSLLFLKLLKMQKKCKRCNNRLLNSYFVSTEVAKFSLMKDFFFSLKILSFQFLWIWKKSKNFRWQFFSPWNSLCCRPQVELSLTPLTHFST